MTWEERYINRRLEIWLHIGIWSAFLLAYILIFARFMPYKLSLARALANVLPMAFLFYANVWLVDKFIERKRYLTFAIVTVLLFLAATFLRTELNVYFPDVRREMLDISKREGWFLGALFTNLSFLVVGFFYQMLYNRYRAERRNLAIINEQKEAQLQALRAQINPHFLFNTLNNIYSLAVVKSDKTAEMVLKLSNLLRYVIYDGKAEQVELKREAEQIKEFIELFQMRSEEPLDIHFDVKGINNNIKIEPMILIPIVENCFKHCDFDTNDNAFIKINLQVQNEILHFNTINTKDDQNQQKDRVGGVGLENIRKRLDLKYKDGYQLLVNSKENTFSVDLTLNIE
ncbi:MAG: histidine kinase [Saprospiraceae bacterium]|nr:histidine kinase [Saprospiraceae bacterium]